MPTLPVLAGFAIGAVFGVVGLLSGFCLMSSLRDWWTRDDGRRIRSYALAVAVAILGTQVVAAAGLIDITKSLYLQPSFSAPLIFIGGILFGLGMMLSNGCASRAVVLLGKGNLRSLAVLTIIGVTAQMTLKGLLAPARLAILQWTQMTPAANSMPALLDRLGLNGGTARIAAALSVGGVLLVFALSHRELRRSPGQMLAGLAMGSLVVAGWLATGWLGADDFDPVPVASLTFISPVADTLQFIMLSTGMTLNFGIALVAGVLVGSLLTALLTGRFAFEGYTSAGHTGRSMAGAALMGIGGAMAYGCSVGQGLTGLSTLALPSFIAVAGILVGAALALRGFAARPVFAAQ
ncbi:YeeE/YedE family protein [Tardiphaga alba]|uniref:YeeE/YedE family protein n=1 Tax=Tardiphaga alba TaxID=340268 RepID=A0ABX8A8X0_9BRAD|nr:YeeE/YedE family protein [Tardiphaga alba]QUS38715.1 YeeE/YedE family protein [Tardiphaga alba]